MPLAAFPESSQRARPSWVYWQGRWRSRRARRGNPTRRARRAQPDSWARSRTLKRRSSRPAAEPEAARNLKYLDADGPNPYHGGNGREGERHRTLGRVRGDSRGRARNRPILPTGEPGTDGTVRGNCSRTGVVGRSVSERLWRQP